MTSVRPTIWKSATELQHFLTEHGFRFCFIGGLAVQRWGEPRATKDVDVALLTGFGTEQSYIRTILEQYAPRLEDAATFAIYSRVLLAEDHRGTPIDIALSGLPFEERAIERSTPWGTPKGGRINTCSAEDLIVFKAFASRPMDWNDIEATLIRQGNRLDRNLILEELTPLAELKEEPEILDRLNNLFRQHMNPDS